MTAHTMQGDRERCLEAGMNDYVTKPVSPQALADALAKWLPGESAARPTNGTAELAAAARGRLSERLNRSPRRLCSTGPACWLG
jgi:DNA-binding response OmpR family regulator